MKAKVAVLAVALAAAGCGSEPAEPGVDGPAGTLTVLAAASLTESFEAIGDDFTALHPDVEIAFSFAGSSSLAAQVTSGAPADVFASASTATMETVTEAGANDAEPELFARNRLQIAVPPGNLGDVTGLADFADEKLAVALCAPEVPCGAAALRALEAAGTMAAPDTLEQDVRAVLAKVRLGEVDAALVYRSDVAAAGDGVEGIDFPEADQAVNDYPITVLRDAPNPEAARAFVDYVLSADGQAVLADAGFDAP